MNSELSLYLARPEFSVLSAWHKELLARWVRRHRGDYPVGRALALACMRLNGRYTGLTRISEPFINWLYYY
jgi:hypothetical protein